MQPDYSIYPIIDNRTSYGFITRGCPNRCKWCIVPAKEGNVRPYMDIDEITMNGMRPYAVLMDNNVLASDYGLSQIEKIVYRKYHIDFNQALDARLVTDDVAKLLSKVKWIKRIRFGCDSTVQIGHCVDAIERIRRYGYNGEFFLYCIILDNMEEAYCRIACWKDYDGKVVPFAQPYRDLYNPNHIIPQWQKDMARWVNRKELFKSCDFWEYEPRKGFKCSNYKNHGKHGITPTCSERKTIDGLGETAAPDGKTYKQLEIF